MHSERNAISLSIDFFKEHTLKAWIFFSVKNNVVAITREANFTLVQSVVFCFENAL